MFRLSIYHGMDTQLELFALINHFSLISSHFVCTQSFYLTADEQMFVFDSKILKLGGQKYLLLSLKARISPSWWISCNLNRFWCFNKLLRSVASSPPRHSHHSLQLHLVCYCNVIDWCFRFYLSDFNHGKFVNNDKKSFRGLLSWLGTELKLFEKVSWILWWN